MNNILKNLVMLSGISLVSFNAFANDRASSLFVGGNVGASVADSTLTSGNLNNNFRIGTGAGWTIGAEAGYRHFLGNKFGFKYYVSYNYMQTFSNSGRGGTGGNSYSMDTTLNQQLIAANVDFFYNFTRSFGVYFGLGAGATTLQPDFAISNNTFGARNQSDRMHTFFALPFNAGFQFNIKDNHTITFGAKIPLLSQDYISSRIPNKEEIKTYMVMLGYTYHLNLYKRGGYWGMEAFKHYRPKLK